MCTVSFIARKNGYALAMNRDEKLTRAAGLPPKIRKVDDQEVLYPSEPGGGTWIALNDTGVTMALINWHSIKAQVKVNAVSRGEVVNAVKTASGKDLVVSALTKLPLTRINPFRLIGVFPAGEIYEWRWNLKRLVCKKHLWKPRQWISSGFDEAKAQRMRSATFKLMQKKRRISGRGWLRDLHSSHAPGCGPFSTCMHRNDAATVSCTEISICSQQATMRYHPGAPCSALKNCVRHLRLQKPRPQSSKVIC